MPRRKEIHFFDLHYERGLDWYREWFAEARGEEAVGEATPGYMYKDQVAERMAAALPHARLLAILRNPIDRAYSHYWRARAQGREDLKFIDAVAAEIEEGPSSSRETTPRRSYLDRGSYARQLQRLSTLYPREQIHVMILEEMREDPQRLYADVCRFLGIDDGFVPENLGRPAGGHKNYRVKALRRLHHRVPASVDRVIWRWNVRPASYPPMDPSLRRELLGRFADDNVALAEWLGRDLSIWSR